MAEDVRDHVTATPVAVTAVTQPYYRDTWEKTYRYLRTAMVALLVGLGAAVVYQIWNQGWHLLSSVSAYYYTPAQAIFVGALIGLGACMIALRGTTDVEDVLLNIGGMFAAVVAIVPTSRGQDYRAAVRACNQAAGPLLTQKAANGLDCPTVQALAAATRANVQNNMTALLVVGVLGLLATMLFFVVRDPSRHEDAGRRAVKFWSGFGVALALVVLAAVAFWTDTDRFIDKAHYLAAIGLFACIFAVAVENARRHRQELGDTPTGQKPSAVGVLVSPGRRDHYALVAWLMVAAAVGGIVLMVLKVITLFWLEIVVALLFAVFWMVQTVEQMSDRQRGEPSPAPVTAPET